MPEQTGAAQPAPVTSSSVKPDDEVVAQIEHETPALQGDGKDGGDGPEDNLDQIIASIKRFMGVAKRLGPAAVLAFLWAVLPMLGGFYLLYQIRPVSDWLVSLGDLKGPAVFAGLFMLFAGTGLLPTYSQAVLAGWAFGPVVGTLAALVGFVGASLIAFGIARSMGAERVEKELARHPKAHIIRDALLKSGPLKTLGIVTLIRIPPNSPFALTNLVLATNRVPLWIYTLATAVGMLPRTAVVVWLGSTIGEELTRKSIEGVEKPRWVFFAMIGSAVAVVYLLMHISNKALEKYIGTGETPADLDAS